MQRETHPWTNTLQRVVEDTGRRLNCLNKPMHSKHKNNMRSHPMPCHKTHIQPAGKGVGSSPFYSARWRMSAEHLSAYKNKTQVPIIELIRVQGGCCLSVVLCTFLSIYSCREQRRTPAPPHQNNFLQLFIVKTISWRYIYPASDAFLIYAIPRGSEREDGEWKPCNMETNCHVPPLRWSRPSLPARQWAGLSLWQAASFFLQSSSRSLHYGSCHNWAMASCISYHSR